MSGTGGLRAEAYRGAAATVAQQVVRLGVQTMSIVVLARLVAPDQFGIFAMVMPVVAVTNLLQDLGLTDAVVQRRDITQAQINSLYWFNVLTACVIASLLVALSPLVGMFFNNPQTQTLTAAWAIPALLGGVSSLQYALLAREMRFITLAILDMTTVVVGFVVAVGAALIWHNYWAMWLSGVAQALAWAIGAMAATGWRPSMPSLKSTDGMLKFGANITGVNLLQLIVENLDKTLIGRFWGAAQVGFYDRAYKLLLFPMQHVGRPFARVAVPILARLRDEPDRLRSVYLRILGGINLVTVPAIAAALATHDELTRVLLGPDWAPAGAIFGWLGIAAIHQPMTSSVTWLMTVQGRASELFKFSIVTSAVLIAAFFVGLPHGALGVACAFAIADFAVRMPIMVFAAARTGPVRIMDFVSSYAPFAIGAAITYVIVELLAVEGVHGLLELALAGVISYAVTIGLMLLFASGRTTLREMVALLERGYRTAASIAVRKPA